MANLIFFLVVGVGGTLLLNRTFWKQKPNLNREEIKVLLKISFGASLVLTILFLIVVNMLGEISFWVRIFDGLVACCISHFVAEMIFEHHNFENKERIAEIIKSELKLGINFGILLIVVGVTAVGLLRITCTNFKG